MDIAIVAGVGLIGSYIMNNNQQSNTTNKNQLITTTSESNSEIKLFPTEFNRENHHVYDNQNTKQLNIKYNNMAELHTNKSKNPVLTNVISPYYQPYENTITNKDNELIMGPIPTTNLNQQLTNQLEDQYNLQTITDISEPHSIGETFLNNNLKDFTPFDTSSNNMTYSIVSDNDFKHNNMQHFTAQRDVETNESNNFEYKMDIFSGASKNWNPKQPAPQFFDPQENIKNPYDTGKIAELERDRLIQSKIKQNQRPFEPEQVAPGLNLNYDEQPTTGFHDPFRAMPISTDELRPANKPKLTFEDRIKGGPKKGENRGITAPVIKRRPLHWRNQTVNDLVPNKSITTKETASRNYVMRDNARLANCELVGHSKGNSLVGPENREGSVNITKRVNHVEDKLGPASTSIHNQNTPSYNILNNGRITTKFDYFQHGKNTNKNGIKFDPNDKSRSTTRETLTNIEFNNNTRQLLSTYSNLSDYAKSTIKQILSTQTYEQILTSNQHNAYANLNDEAKTTLKQILSLAELNTQISSQQKHTTTAPTDIANQTLRELLSTIETNTMMKANNNQSTSYYTDISKPTIKESFADISFNNNIGSTQSNPIANYTDISKQTLKEILTVLELNTNINSIQQNPIANLSDNAKTTFKEILSNIQTNTMIKSNQKESISEIMDIAKSTIKQLLTTSELNTNINSNNKQNISNLTDNAKLTTKQTLTNAEFNTFVSRTLANYSNLNDKAKTTIKQILATQPLETIISSVQKKSYSNIQDNIKQTIKQLLTIKTLNNNIKQNPASYANLTDNAKSTLKELTSIIQNNNNIKSSKKSTYSELSDIAKNTIKEFISTKPLNNNMKTTTKEVAFNPNDLARTTHKEDLLNENYISSMVKSSKGSKQTSFDILPTLKDITKIVDYISAPNSSGLANQPQSQKEFRNMRHNINKEVIAKGVKPTPTNVKQIPTKEIYNSLNQKIKPNFTRMNPPNHTSNPNLNDRFYLDNNNETNFPSYDERLYNELLTQLNDNPLVNNPNTSMIDNY